MFSSTVRLLPGYILVLLLAGTSVAQAQSDENRVPLTLEYHQDVEEEGTLPGSTEVLVYHEAGTRATPLSAWGSRFEIRPNLAEKAKNNFGAVFDKLGENGETDSLRIATEPRQIVYVLARISEGGDARFYESQVGGSDVEPGPGLDLVVSGNMDMDLVSENDTDWAASTFERVIETELNLQHDGQALSEDVEVRVWKKDGRDFESLDDRESIGVEDDPTSSSVTDVTTDEQFERTAYSSKIVYVLARATDAEGEPVLYESVEGDDAAGFVSVTDGTIQMQPVPEQHQATMAELFPPSEGGKWFTWTFFGLLGGLLLVVLLIAGQGLKKQKKKRNQRRQKGRMKRFWDAVLPSSDKKSKPVEKSPAQDSGTVKKGASKQKSKEIVERERENDLPKGEIIAGLKEEVKELKEKIRKRDAKIQELNEQQNGTSTTEKIDSRSTSTQKVQQSKSSVDKISDIYVDWCQSRGPAMVDKYFAFESLLNDNVTHAKFNRIYRDRDSTEILFGEKGSVQDPVEYWLIVTEGQRFLFPQPSRNGFRELGDSFVGSNVSPSNISKAKPAEIKPRGNRFVLEKKGRIE